MKLFLKFLSTKKWSIICFFAFVTIFSAALLLYRVPIGAVVYPTAVCAVCGAGVLIAGFLRQREKHLLLDGIAECAAAEIEALPEAISIDDRDYQKIILSLKRQTAEITAENNRKLKDTVEYFTLWAHQIKTPIASMRLTLEGEDSPLSRRLTSDLFRIEQYAEMVMTYLRLDFDTTDYLLREYDADELVKKSVRSFSGEFINKRLSLDYSPLNISVITDEKWFCFVLEQLLSNAVKYTVKGGIRIYLKDGLLCVEDSGMGIAAEDIPRIFEKGYTGTTGRSDRHSSGIGLYLCRRICKNLNISLSVHSKVGKGSVFELGLSDIIKEA